MSKIEIDEKVEMYLEKQKELFLRLKAKKLHKGKVFIEDGIVNPKEYFSKKERIVFLLKEAYDDDNKGFSLNKYLDNENLEIDIMWKKVSEWTRLIVKYLNGYDKVDDIKESDIKYYGNEYLRRIAVINIKKSDGQKNSKDKNLAIYVNSDEQELFEQLEICDPNIIVCGNVEGFLKQIIGKSNEKLIALSKLEKDHYVYHFKLNGHDVTVVSYWHPSNQFPNLLNYYAFAHICKVAFGKR